MLPLSGTHSAGWIDCADRLPAVGRGDARSGRRGVERRRRAVDSDRTGAGDDVRRAAVRLRSGSLLFERGLSVQDGGADSGDRVPLHAPRADGAAGGFAGIGQAGGVPLAGSVGRSHRRRHLHRVCERAAVMTPVLSFAQWLQYVGWAAALRYSAAAYPLVLTLHIVGIAFFGGLIIITDLRLLGVTMRRLPMLKVIGAL